MSDNSRIEWTDATWSPTLGCTHVSEGCDGCYAMRTVHRMSFNPNEKISSAAEGLTAYRPGVGVVWTNNVRVLPDRLGLPLQWKKPKRIFVDSQSDLFHDQVPDEFIAKVFAVMAATPRHTYQILTKRPGRLRSLLNSERFRELVFVATNLDIGETHGDYWPLPNVWLGVSVENQRWADVRVPLLLDTPATVHWLSCEPLLGPVDLTKWTDAHGPWNYTEYGVECLCRAAIVDDQDRCNGDRIDWVVAGGESGPGARPMHPDWARSLRDQCQEYAVPFLFKQWGEHAPLGPCSVDEFFALGESRRRERLTWMEPDGAESHGWEWDPTPGASLMERVGKKAAGRYLDGRTWDEYPEARS
jgi:protein gp37